MEVPEDTVLKMDKIIFQALHSHAQLTPQHIPQALINLLLSGWEGGGGEEGDVALQKMLPQLP